MEDANSTVVSALDWANKLVPQTIRIIYIAFWSTVIVILVAVPLGISSPGRRCAGSVPSS